MSVSNLLWLVPIVVALLLIVFVGVTLHLFLLPALAEIKKRKKKLERAHAHLDASLATACEAGYLHGWNLAVDTSHTNPAVLVKITADDLPSDRTGPFARIPHLMPTTADPEVAP
jgi:hypothetical protein